MIEEAEALRNTLMEYFNTELLPSPMAQRIQDRQVTEEELLGCAGYLLALLPKNPFVRVLKNDIRRLQVVLFNFKWHFWSKAP